MEKYNQFDIIWAKYPLSDKVGKTINRPALIISNELSNDLDNDYLVCQITSTIRNDSFAIKLSNDRLVEPLGVVSEVRTNKIMTIRSNMITGKVSALRPEYSKELLTKIFSAIVA